jgi:spore maturation protein CgeB
VSRIGSESLDVPVRSTPTSVSVIRAVVLHVTYGVRASYLVDWRRAFETHHAFSVASFNLFKPGVRAQVAKAIRDCDVVVLLHSTNVDSLMYLRPYIGLLQARTGRLVCFVGNEVNLPGISMTERFDTLRALGVDVIASQLLLETARWLYQGLPGRVVSLPHAVDPEIYRPVVPSGQRSVDLGVRGFRYLAHVGDDDRNRICDFFARTRVEPPLAIDFDHDERFDGPRWASFLNRCKGTVSSEAGSWYLDPQDEHMAALESWAASRRRGMTVSPESPLRRLFHRLPWPLKVPLRRLLRHAPIRPASLADEAVTFEEVQARFFAPRARCVMYSKCMAPRHFEAAATKTCQIMFAGRFNDVLEADTHYLALADDFSNVDDVLARFRDEDCRQAMVDRLFDHVMAGHTYRHRLDALAAALEPGA